MAITCGFFNAIKDSRGNYDRTYNADQMSTYFEGLVSDGVYESVGDALQVVAGSGMEVQVKSGRALIGARWLKNDSAYSITLKASHVTLNRYTAIVARLDMPARTITIVAKDGTNATTPTKPAITNSNTVKELCLAYVYVGRGVTTITQSAIEDTRANTKICGWVTGIIEQVDTSQLFLQWQTAYEEFYQKWTNDFETWFSALTEQLNVNTYIQKYHKVIDIGTKTGVFPLDMNGYTYEESDIILANVNGVMLTEVYDYSLDTSKTPVEMHTNVTLDAENILEITILKSKIGQG